MFENIFTSSYYRVLVIVILVFWVISSLFKFDFVGAFFALIPLAYVWDTGALASAYSELSKLAPWMGAQTRPPTPSTQ